MTIQYFIKQLEMVWDGTPWYGLPFEKTLDDLNEDYVFKKETGFTHSIAEVLVHVNSWRQNLLEMLAGNGSFAILPDSELDWAGHVDEMNWTDILNETKSLHQTVLTALSNQSDDLLEKTVPEREYNYKYLIHGVVQHDIYHLGQIRQMYRYFERS